VREALERQARIPLASIEVVTPKPDVPADLAFPTFRLARQRNIAPPRFAEELVAVLKFDRTSLVGRLAAAGPFLNFTLDPAHLAAAVMEEVAHLGARYGEDDLGAGQTIVVEYSSPNMARRMHVGHIRSTIIGHALAHILTALGFRVVRDNHIGDWGKNFGILLTAIRHEGKPAGEGEDALATLERLYATYNRRTEEEPAIDQEARDWSLRLEAGDPEARDLWQWIVQMTLRINQPLYDRLGVRFDTIHGESFYDDQIASVLADAIARRAAHRNEDGAVVVDVQGLPTFLLQRSDGGTLYQARDAATIAYRLREYHPAAIVYAVDARQELHFRQLFALMHALGTIPPETKLVHVGFGVIAGPDGQPLAARRGNMVYLQALLDEAHARARSIVERASPDLPTAEKEKIAEAVGIGAVIYNDLHQDPRRNITLDWDRMLALQGNSAPYIQYMHARCHSILRRAAITLPQAHRLTADPSMLTHPAETRLVKQLGRLPGAIRDAGSGYTPAVLATWCYETARATAVFYRDCPVLATPTDELRAARLRLVAATAQSLANGLQHLGIRAPERM
jgi:arginyl-tRNA synthetase